MRGDGKTVLMSPSDRFSLDIIQICAFSLSRSWSRGSHSGNELKLRTSVQRTALLRHLGWSRCWGCNLPLATAPPRGLPPYVSVTCHLLRHQQKPHCALFCPRHVKPGVGKELIMTAVFINRIGEPAPSESIISTGISREEIVAPD
ncbi:hypothetical protein VTI74DRAFT_5896 [Chaetomium olivicolor]